MRRFIKKLLILSFLLLLSLSISFADTIDGSSDAVLLLLPRSLTYSQSDAIEMTTAKAMVVSDLGDTPLTFTSRISEDGSKNLGFVRLQDTLHNLYTSIPTYKGYKYSNYNNSDMFVTDNCVTLNIQTTGLFVNVNDASKVRDFTLSCFLTEAHIENDGSEYTTISGFPMQMTLGETITLSDTVFTTHFKSLGGSNYELYLPSTPVVSCSSNNNYGNGGGPGQNNKTYYYYPLLMRVYDLCIVLPDTDTTLPEGFYKTEITITSTGSYKNRTFTGEYSTSYNSTTIYTNLTETSMSETITVWGYVGSTSSGTSSTFSFSVSPSTNSFSMDLGDTDTYYSVASVNFYNVTGPYTSDSEPSKSTQKEKYKIYLSPTSNYLEAGSYVFTKTTKKQDETDYETIPYDIYLDSSGMEFSSNSTTNVGGSGVGDGTTIPSSTYYILPNYSMSKETLSGSSTKYTETWRISTLPIYLKVEEETNVTHTAGEYKTYLYFTVVSD